MTAVENGRGVLDAVKLYHPGILTQMMYRRQLFTFAFPKNLAKSRLMAITNPIELDKTSKQAKQLNFDRSFRSMLKISII